MEGTRRQGQTSRGAGLQVTARLGGWEGKSPLLLPYVCALAEGGQTGSG